jgi:hypothetical protein
MPMVPHAPGHRRATVPLPVVELLEGRRLQSVSAATLFGTTTAGATLTYQVQDVGFKGIATRTVTIAPATTFDGHAVVERDTVDSEVVGTQESTDTTSDDEALTDAGVVEYGSTDAPYNSHYLDSVDTTDTYAPPIVEYPALLTAGTTYTSAWSGTEAVTGDPTSSSSVTGTHAVTLVSATPQPLAVPAGTFDAYELTVVDTAAGAAPVTQQEWVAPGVGVIESVVGGDGSYELASVAGTSTTPAPTTALTPTIARTTIPTEVVAGTARAKVVDVTIDDGGTSTSGDRVTVAVYATTTGVVNAGSTLIGTAQRRPTLRAGRSTVVPVRVSAAGLADGTYALVARLTDVTTGAVADTDAATAVAIAAPTVTLSLTVGPQSPATVPAGRSVSFTLTVADYGNIDSTGPATITVGLTTLGTNVTVPLPAQKRSVRVNTGGKPTAVRVRIVVPVGTAPDNYAINVTFAQPMGSASASGINALFVS